MRTIAVHVGGIGDLLLTAPALARLALEGPLELAGRGDRLDLLVAGGIATAAHELDAIDFDSVFSAPSKRLRAFLEPFHRAIIWMRDDGSIANNLRACGLSDVRAFSGLPAGNGSRHASAYYLECLGFPASDTPFRLHIPAARTEHDVIIHPGSGSPLKNWPMDRFAEIAQTLEGSGRRVEWCAGPAETSLRLPARALTMPPAPLVDLARHLAATRLYIGNDSGITHLAASVGCIVVAIYGQTDPQKWAPLGPRVHIVQGDPWPTTTTVRNAVTSLRPSPRRR
ncbi:MAG TPA: glycosyltransferase family 9 protein [Candidatus Hydrogenedentes bacterium]|nr:glycosyltransferase family 9 protein [Candidatus Hydrogenedentota bacterium]HOS02397.1 glycosyltransferase family 9 protein [Candidatus Hydrogenedentota bacterium]